TSNHETTSGRPIERPSSGSAKMPTTNSPGRDGAFHQLGRNILRSLVIALVLGHGARAILFTARGADDTCRPLAKAKFRTIYLPCEKINLIITMTAVIGRCQAVIRRFLGFPAVSLPRLRFDRRIAHKVLIRKDFRCGRATEKIFR